LRFSESGNFSHSFQGRGSPLPGCPRPAMPTAPPVKIVARSGEISSACCHASRAAGLILVKIMSVPSTVHSSGRLILAMAALVLHTGIGLPACDSQQTACAHCFRAADATTPRLICLSFLRSRCAGRLLMSSRRLSCVGLLGVVLGRWH